MSQKPSLLVVDDESGILDTLRILLRNEGFEVTTAQGGKAGLEQIRWPAPVRAGDVLRLRIEVRETRRSQTREHLGILRWRWNLYNERDELVLDLVATSLFDLSGRLPPP